MVNSVHKGIRKNKANSRRHRTGRGLRDEHRGFLSIDPRPCGHQPSGPIVRNKPNSRRAKCPTIPLFHHSNIPGPGLSCETKPISCADKPTRAEALPPPTRIVRNKPNSSGAKAMAKYFVGKELGRIGCPRDLGKTKPISARTAGAKGREGANIAGGAGCTNKPNLQGWANATDRNRQLRAGRGNPPLYTGHTPDRRPAGSCVDGGRVGA